MIGKESPHRNLVALQASMIYQKRVTVQKLKGYDTFVFFLLTPFFVFSSFLAFYLVSKCMICTDYTKYG